MADESPLRNLGPAMVEEADANEGAGDKERVVSVKTRVGCDCVAGEVECRLPSPSEKIANGSATTERRTCPSYVVSRVATAPNVRHLRPCPH